MRIERQGVVIEDLDGWWRTAPPKDPAKHWVDGRSAKETARAWLANAPDSAPPEVASLLSSHTDFVDLVIERVEPEALLAFDDRPGPRNADLAIIARDMRGLVALSIEAKADETFDDPVADVFGAALERLLTNPRSGGVARLLELAQSILPPRVPGTSAVSDLRYQLLTAVAGTLAYAAALEAERAVFVVHEFHTTQTSLRRLAQNAADLDRFVARLSQGSVVAIEPGLLMGPFIVPGEPLFPRQVALYIGKAVRRIGTPSA